MTPNLLASRLSAAEQETPISSRIPAALDALDQGTIADLPSTRISDMNCDELVRVIQNAHLPFLNEETIAHLVFQDRQTLERLANLAQRCCFNRTIRPGSLVGDTNYERQTFEA
jgi:hypothetical protein